ncbi:MAG TPA: HutD family protein [Beijerinckiaceae bacterium]|jgi:environmental stress-induced protein Ves|nr:HutD family protein [Beijerinckiaceae bacterium]
MKILRAGQHRRMPWKNGGGETTEIIAFPEGVGLDEFEWRISMARVAMDGPFSRFPDVERTLCVIEGEALALTIAGKPEVVLTQVSAPFGFPGDVAVTSRLAKGPITDLNVMTRRGRWSHKVTRLSLAGPQLVKRAAGVTLLLSRSQGLMIAEKDGLETLDTDDAALFEGALEMRLEPASGAAGAYLVELRSEAP